MIFGVITLAELENADENKIPRNWQSRHGKIFINNLALD